MLQDIVQTLADGFLVTVGVFAGSAIVAALAALLAGLMRISRSWPLRAAADLYIAFFRGTSALVQLFWVYFALPLVGVSFDPLPAGIVVLGLNTGAYGAEIVRGAVDAVPKGQYDAARALGMSRAQTLRHVILPQALVRMLPPFGNLLVELLKNTALVSTITLADMTYQANTLLRDRYPDDTMWIFGVVLAVYFVLSQLVLLVTRTSERKLAAGTGWGEGR